MGHGGYSSTWDNSKGSYSYDSSIRDLRAKDRGFYTKSRTEIFNSKNINSSMNPYGVQIRESRDSIEHPNSVPIIIGIDVTGSMGSVPHYLVKEGLPKIMEKIILNGILDPQVLFVAIGDHECDNSPLQIGQFESSDSSLDKWLTDTWLEGGGGGNAGESYLLAWYFAANHTAIDSLEKRGRKGFLFTIGDEPVLSEIPSSALKGIMGIDQPQSYTAQQLYEKAKEKYHVYHIHIKETSSGSRQRVIDEWKQLLSDNLLVANRHTEVSGIISEIILKEKDSIVSGISTPSIHDSVEEML